MTDNSERQAGHLKRSDHLSFSSSVRGVPPGEAPGSRVAEFPAIRSSGAAFAEASAECFQDRTKRFGFQAQNVQPKTRLTPLNVIVLGCGQIISWIGMKVCPYVMGCYVAGIRIVFSSHPKNHAKRNMQSGWHPAVSVN